MIKKCVILIVLDSVGVGELPDAQKYGDKGSNTLKNLAEKVGGVNLPHLEKMGLGLIGKFKGIKEVNNPTASFGKMAEASSGKDTTSGHWEIVGLILDNPFPTYPNGFPSSIIESFKEQIGKDVLGNIPASGTEIIKQLGEKHMETGYPIVYTSADSVFQIAAHEEVIPVKKLYEMCLIARQILEEPDNVSRVIARPFIGKPGSFQRTERRKDFSLLPPQKTLLDFLKEKNIPVIGIGKIEDIFAGRGLTESIHTKNNMDGFNKLIEMVKKVDEGFIFINLVDFDMLYGHRNSAEGYAKALEEFDQRLPELLNILGNDILIITADHGCDPTTVSTDHSREYVPLLITGKELKAGVNLGIRKTFADVGQTIADIFEIDKLENGESFLESLKKHAAL